MKAGQILRTAIRSELEAVNLYETLADNCDDAKVRKVLLDVAREEKVHAGEFSEMLKKVDSQYGPAVKEGESEALDKTAAAVSVLALLRSS